MSKTVIQTSQFLEEELPAFQFCPSYMILVPHCEASSDSIDPPVAVKAEGAPLVKRTKNRALCNVLFAFAAMESSGSLSLREAAPKNL